MTSFKVPPTSLNDTTNGSHGNTGDDVTVPAGESGRSSRNIWRPTSSSPEAVPMSRHLPSYPVGDFYGRRCPVPIPIRSESHVQDEDATWFLDTGSPPTWQGYGPEAFWMQNPYVAAANQQQAAELLRYGSIPDDTWLQYPYAGNWEALTFENESEDFRTPPRNRSYSDASSFAKKKRSNVKRTVTFATDRGGCDQIIDDKGPLVRNSSSERVDMPKQTDSKVEKILRNGHVASRWSDSAAAEAREKAETPGRPSQGSTLRTQASEQAAPQSHAKPSSPTSDEKEKRVSAASPPPSLEAESRLSQTCHSKHTESANQSGTKGQVEENVRRARSYSMNGSSSSSSSSSMPSSTVLHPRRRLSLGTNEVKRHIDVTANLNVQFRYDEEKDPGERIQFGRNVTCRVDGQGGMEDATHVTYLSKGRVLITDMLDGKLHLLSQSGEVLRIYAIDSVTEPWATAVTSEGVIVVTSRTGKCVTLLNVDGTVTSSFGKDVLQCPSGVAYDKQSGRIVVTDTTANKIFVFTLGGELLGVLGEESGLKHPSYAAISPQGEVIVSDSGNHSVRVFSWAGELLQEFGKLGKEDGCLKSPQGVTTDSSGNILVCDHYNNRVSVFSPQGEFIRHLLTSLHGIGHPQSLALTPDLKLYVTHGKSKATDVTVFDLEYGEFV